MYVPVIREFDEERFYCLKKIKKIKNSPYKPNQSDVRFVEIFISDGEFEARLQRAYLLFEGKILKSGTAHQLAEDEHVRKVYLGKNFELRK